ncbi:DNA primase [Aggregatibacter actinomycetemcomitans]|uniref:DNA primase family protein n=1 Tax=Aggregatibacter actinomycetemcomitans TaxID=714 RepID=UPI00197BEDC8|nr:phage/plasmid primase, P4 family [Aggregatibacter actinomycetemcomitans]MBN6073909.1 DNA primase [Aggregatibacter actinomycetemcomitans]
MARLINAPHLADQPKSPFPDLIILAGRKAWQAWNKGEGEEWLLLCSLVEGIDAKQKPVILADKQLEDILSIKIADPEQRSIMIFQYGELFPMEITGICQNLANNTKAENVVLYDGAAQEVENLSDYIQRLRTDESAVEMANKIAPAPKLKEKDGTNVKARAFVKWLNLDIAQHSLDKELYSYTGVNWEMIPRSELEVKAVQFYDEQEFTYSTRSIDSMIDTAKIQAPKMGEQAKELLAFKNGVLNRSTLEFNPHCRENWLSSVIPHDYTNQAENTPHFDRWLDFVADGKADKKQAILAALYAILTNRHNWQLFFEITGDGGSGKSIFSQIATLLTGEQNTESGRLIDLDEPRGRETFEGKTLIVCPEQSRYGVDGGGLKSVSGGDPVNIDPKHKTKFKAVIPAIVLIVNNELTRFTERSGGIERRRVIFHFDKVVPLQERDPHLMSKIEAEAGGIIYKLIQAFKNPIAAKQALEAQKESGEALAAKMESDHITAFCSYFITTQEKNGLEIGNANTGLPKTHLYPAYLVFIEANNIQNGLNLNNFTESLKQGLAQHGNKYPYSRKCITAGIDKGRYITNVHFKDYLEFQNEYVKSNR